MGRRQIEWLCVAVVYVAALGGHILIGQGAAFAGGGVLAVMFVAYTLRAIG